MLKTCTTPKKASLSHDIRTLDDIRGLIETLPMANEGPVIEARQRDIGLTKPRGSLGRLEEIVFWLCRWQQSSSPSMENPQTCVFAGNHGIVQHDVSAFPASVTALMVENFARGGAAINQLSTELGAEVTVRALDLDRPTRDFTVEAAMSEDECVDAFRIGMEAVNPEASLLCPGEMGIGNTTSAAAICHVLWGGTPTDWVGSGTGINKAQYDRKIDVVKRTKACHGTSVKDGLDVLRCVGGREIVAMAGAIIAARLLHIPVMLDGFICGAAAAALHETSSKSLLHCMVGHGSVEPGHRLLLDRIGKRPLLDLDLRLGEGTGAVIAGLIVRAAVTCHNNMASFGDIGISADAISGNQN
ncbi:nicotinate-nucleotide--dimethylbenzimidazole phosphoribosyltransferase [Thalassospira xiamenensis]|jgi:nicotinate-nucleotide--dimethylbenzimidazole phosphoribosyltransferase|uniref:nicotinate-nucleotide--dimethylbenzimidazole phosphoribosyltransferase n=1 Tax=Thalassospira xiamenensis TaxID=220697 RepID=UPI000E80D1BF|nr:nicotinate-nucleotide--dimethylbenzimidazole phosphoribosyltransferase [Thalassospira xiamenensis]HBN50485.1 nicotinate-nucleotide--dimethylbenzimidazole phosphoribosyltransferase [Thalassospira sp.]|tara:strand:- start:5209 stop:6282 length:1074 start_codon:yes stop_codon:yes gene_type:complete